MQHTLEIKTTSGIWKLSSPYSINEFFKRLVHVSTVRNVLVDRNYSNAYIQKWSRELFRKLLFL